MIRSLVFLFNCFFLQLSIGGGIRVELNVIGEDGVAISDAVVRAAFPTNDPKKIGQRLQKTDEKGRAVLLGESRYKVAVSVKKPGYYTSRYVHQSANVSFKKTIKLRKEVNPVPMYAKHVKLEFPALNEQIGFDLQAGDWTQPFGKGVVADVLLTASVEKSGFEKLDFSIDMGFSNEADGIASFKLESGDRYSAFPYLHFAPDVGYSPSARFFIKIDETGTHSNTQDLAFNVLRVRSEVQDGVLVSANYAKIYPLLVFTNGFVETPGVNFTYYLNPKKNDISLEFDTKRNLFTDLGRFDRVVKP